MPVAILTLCYIHCLKSMRDHDEVEIVTLLTVMGVVRSCIVL